MLALLLFMSSALADKLEITAVDGVTDLELDCGEGPVLHKPPVVLNPAPTSCKVTAWKPVSELPQTGVVSCTPAGCELGGESTLLEVTASAPISAIMLDCDGTQNVWAFEEGKVRIEVAGACHASLGATVGTIPAGVWACGLTSCASDSAAHDVTLVVAGVSSVALSCNDDTLREAAVQAGSVTFKAVPHESCTAVFKGAGPPAKARPIAWGTSNCELNGATAVCRKP